MKRYIFTKEELKLIPLSERSKYYLDDYLVATVQKFTNNQEEMVVVESQECGLKVEPFWMDQSASVTDPFLQEILDQEGILFRKYMQDKPNFGFFLRKSVLLKLQEVQKQLPNHLQLVLKAGYRPLQVQKWLFEANLDFLRKRFPEKTEQELYKMNLEFVADPQNFIPPHSTGAAVDLYLFDNDKNAPLDMGCPINYPDDLSWTWNMQNLTSEQQKNRIFLTELMIANGFANLASEWWHYSYGDQYWALFYDQEEALFNAIEL